MTDARQKKQDFLQKYYVGKTITAKAKTPNNKHLYKRTLHVDKIEVSPRGSGVTIYISQVCYDDYYKAHSGEWVHGSRNYGMIYTHPGRSLLFHMFKAVRHLNISKIKFIWDETYGDNPKPYSGINTWTTSYVMDLKKQAGEANDYPASNHDTPSPIKEI